MIRRLDLPSAQATFTHDGNSIPPTASKWTQPIDRIRFTDTVYTAPSRGLTGTWFENTSVGRTVPVDTAYISNEPLMKFWYGTGIPPYYNITNVGEVWSVNFKGYMQLPYAADYTFSMGGSGVITKFELNATNIITSDEAGGTVEKDLSYLRYATTTPFTEATEGVWRLIEIEYEQRAANDPLSGLCILWETDDAIATPDKIVLSAGVTHIFGEGAPVTGEDAIPDTAVPHYGDVNLSLSEGQGDTFTFTVPFMTSANPVSSAGYFYEPSTDIYRHIDTDLHSGKFLKKFRRIEYSQGYYSTTNAVDEFVQKFSGQIRDFNISLNSRSGDTLEVVCHGYSILTRDQFNTNVPTPIDYVASGYTADVKSHVDGRVKPPSFDGWEVHKAFAIMCMNSFLDPYYMTLRHRKSNIAGDLLHGNYFVEPYGLSYEVYLDRDAVLYGHPFAVAPDSQSPGVTTEPDAPYLHEIGFGEFYQDAISKIVDTYGMEWGVNRFGYAYLKAVDIPRSFENDRDATNVDGGAGGDPA